LSYRRVETGRRIYSSGRPFNNICEISGSFRGIRVRVAVNE